MNMICSGAAAWYNRWAERVESGIVRSYGMYKITGYIEKDPETGLYVAIVPSIPGAHTQA